MKKTFIFYLDRQDYTSVMTLEEKGQFLQGLLDFHNGKEIDMNGSMKFVWARIIKQLEDDNIKYVEKVKKRSDAGKKGNDKRWNNKGSQMGSNDRKGDKKIAKIAVNDNVILSKDNILPSEEGRNKIRELVPDLIVTKQNQLLCLWEMILLGWDVVQTKEVIIENIKRIEESAEKNGHIMNGSIDWGSVCKCYFSWRTWREGKKDKPKNYRASLNTFLNKSGIQKK